jgi:NAD(P)-dependent dehydrogenase (short-subunit alcohol dehydrogenase family)
MAIVFITGSTDGLRRAAAESLLGGGHQVVLHARSADRAATIAELASRSAGVVVGDLRGAAETRASQIRSTRSGEWMRSSITPASIRCAAAVRHPTSLPAVLGKTHRTE